MFKFLFNREGEFTKRIKKRHSSFWSPADAENIRNTPMSADDPLDKWKDVIYWQRKLSNKYNAREFAKKHGLQVPELYWKGRDCDKIEFEHLSPQFVIRPTVGHSSNFVYLMNNGVNIFDHKPCSANEIRSRLKDTLDKNPDMEFLIEEFLKDENGEYLIPVDYKIYCFNGEIACIGVINRTGPKEGSQSFYDIDWKMIKNFNHIYSEASYQPPPDCLPQILQNAVILSKTYQIFVRIDFYATDRGAVFGEFTPTPAIGQGFTSSAQKFFISYWDKYCKDMI